MCPPGHLEHPQRLSSATPPANRQVAGPEKARGEHPCAPRVSGTPEQASSRQGPCRPALSCASVFGMRRRRGRHAPSRSTRSINRARVEPPDICEMESGEDDSDEEEPAAAAAAAPQRCDGAPAHASPCARRVVCDRCGKCDKHCPSWKHSGYECREIEEEAAQPGQRRRRARPSTEAATVDAAAAAAAAAAAEAAAAAVVNQPPAAPAAAHRQLRDEHAAPSDVTAAYGFKKSFGTNSYNSTGEKVSAA